MKNDLLSQALSVSLEDVQNVDEAIEEMAIDQAGDNLSDHTGEIVSQIDADTDMLDEVRAVVEDQNASMEQLAHARGIVDAIGHRYGAVAVGVSLESNDLDRDKLLADIDQYKVGLEDYATASMEGLFLNANNLADAGKNIDIMRKTVSVLSSGKEEQIKNLRLGPIRNFLKIGGGVPKDIPTAIKNVSEGMTKTLKHADNILAQAQKAGELALRTDWKDADAADKARKQIAGMKLGLADIVSDVNGFPMFGNRSFGVKVSGEVGGLGEFNKKFSFSEGVPNYGKLQTAVTILGVAGIVSVAFIPGILTLVVSNSIDKARNGERELGVKALGNALTSYVKVAERVHGDRANAIKKSTVHKKLVTDLKTAKIPKDVRKAIVRVSSFGWSMTNGVYSVISHSTWALASLSLEASYK